jgi:hypothetical protein
VTVEAETVEDALAEISAEFGEDAEIMRAQKVHRGGVGGFFAKEMVQLTARRRRETPQPLRPLRPLRQSGGIADVLERMAQDADAEDSDFRTVLERELSAESTTSEPPNFLAAAGWDEPGSSAEEPAGASVDEPADEPTDENDAAPESATANSGDDHFVPPFAESEAFPEPVVVGPALRSVPEPVELAADIVDEIDEPLAAHLPVAGPVIPLRDPANEDFDSAAMVSGDEVVAPAAAPVAEVIEPAPLVVVATEDVDIAEVPEDHADEWRTAQPDDAPVGMGRVSWSTTALLRLGLPAPVLAAVSGLDDDDDFGWLEAIAAVVAPHCGSLPEENVIIVGPHAERLAEPLGLPLVRSGDMAPYDGSFCAMVEDSPEDRNWLEYVRGGRGIHLVVGDEPWQDLLIDEPVAVSWVGETAVGDALYLAFTLGATLGFGTVDGFVSSMVRAQPTDVALAVRRIVGRR